MTSRITIVEDTSLPPILGDDDSPLHISRIGLSPVSARRINAWISRAHAGFHRSRETAFLIACLMKIEKGVTVVHRGPAGDTVIEDAVAKETIDARSWPDGKYFHHSCNDCLAPFSGDKREFLCRSCRGYVTAQNAPKTMIRFELGRFSPGVTPEMVPDDVPVLSTTFFAGTRNICRLILAETTHDVLNRVTDLVRRTGGVIRAVEDDTFGGAPEAPQPAERDTPLRPMADAPRDGTPVLLRFRFDLGEIRPRSADFSGIVFVGRNRAAQGGPDGWNFAAPVGCGGFPDDWLQGWAHLSEGIEA